MMYYYSLVKTKNATITQLCLDKMLMACPNKTSSPNMQQERIRTINHSHQDQVVFKGFITQACDSTCPLFEFNQERKKITVFCGCTPRTFDVEELIIEKKDDKPGSSFQVEK